MRRSITSPESVPRRSRRARRFARSGGAMKTYTPGSPRAFSCAPPWTSISSRKNLPCASARSMGSRGGPYRLPWTSAHSMKAPRSISPRKRALSMKWYSRPSTSPGRGARVVALTENSTRGSAIRRLQIVLLPEPEGPETTSIVPSAAIPLLNPLLDVLHLLAQALDVGLGLHHPVGDGGVGALGADRVHLAEDLLHEKVELAADAPALRDEALELAEVAGEARELLGDVQLVGLQRDLAREVGAGHGHLRAEERLHALRERGAVTLDDARHALLDPRRELLELGGVPAQVGRERPALCRTHLQHACQRLVHELEHGLARVVTVGRARGIGEHARQRHERVERQRRRHAELGRERGELARVAPRELVVDARGRGGARALVRQADADRAALALRPHALLDLRLERREGLRQAQLDHQVPVVDAAHLDAQRRAARLARGGPEARHRAQHDARGSSTSAGSAAWGRPA